MPSPKSVKRLDKPSEPLAPWFVREREPMKCKTFFLDSGAFSLYYRFAHKRPASERWAFYDSAEFWQYLQAYAEFVLKWGASIDHYANLDVLRNPKLSWRNQQILEENYGLKPIPVLHVGTPLKWVDHYLSRGYPYIGLGAFTTAGRREAREWTDRVFRILCPASNHHLPLVKVHGFAMTGWYLMTRYPWFSVDSTAWLTMGINGKIYIPRRLHGQYSFEKIPYTVGVSDQLVEARKQKYVYIDSYSPGARKVILDWLEFNGIPFGRRGANGEVIEEGVSTSDQYRLWNNLQLFEMWHRSLPPWPWAFAPEEPVLRGMMDSPQ